MPRIRHADENDPELFMTLQLDCWSDELSPAQLAAFEKAEKERNDVRSKLDEIVTTSGGENIFLGEIFSAYTVPGTAPGIEEIAKPIAKVRKEVLAQKKPPVEEKKRETSRKREYKNIEVLDDDDDDEYIPISKRAQKAAAAKTPIEKKKEPIVEKKVDKKGKTPTPVPTPSIPSSFRPTENTAIGGLSVGDNIKKKDVVDLTKDDGSKADTREITFNKLQGKTYPSLVVVARPSLKVKDNVNDRGALDTKVKGVLMHTATKFTEWLIQQGLVRSEQMCQIHLSANLKLGMYSDATKFPFSGGYVWISECCPTRFVSVFSGSLFEGSPHPPSVLLKLIYHWACQTNVQNVVQWVKVDNLYVKEFYARLRSVCTVAVHQHMHLLGGPGKKIEVGVISLGTTSQDGQQRQVKVEVLGVMDAEAKIVRLRAVEPLSDGEKNYKKRFSKILEPLPGWVMRDSQIVTDLTVDKGTLNSMGYKFVCQTNSGDTSAKNTNSNIMDYLRRIVPRMFQNTLSLLSRQIIQQFLDELVWREWYGTSPGITFDNIVAHISEQTRFDSKETLVARLAKVSANPFKSWAHISTKPLQKSTKEFKVDSTAVPSTSAASLPPAKRGRKRREPSPDYVPKAEVKQSNVVKKVLPKVTYEEPKKEKEPTVHLEQYYYGVINQAHTNDSATPINFKVKCILCDDEFTSNTTLMNHLKQHANPAEGKAIQCSYCLDNIPDEDKLLKHHILIHPVETKNSLGQGGVFCVICETKFNTTSNLANHMQKTHVASDLPYRCGCCDYTSSVLRWTIDHFYLNHADSGILQCSFCLQIYAAVDASGNVLTANINDYYEHLKYHMNKNQCKKCNHCALSFTSKGLLKLHQSYAHTSHANKPKMVHTICKNTQKIPKPRNKNHYNKDHLTYLSKLHNMSMFVENGQMCLECNTDFEELGHFSGLMKCNKCKYHTCCLRIMLEHTASCDGGNNQEISTISPLEKEMHCICGFSSNDGNALARHLVTCERRSAYGSVELVQENTVKRNMLDMLGLVRRDEDEESDDLLLPANEADRTENESEDESASQTNPSEQLETPASEQANEQPNAQGNIENIPETHINTNDQQQFITQLSLDDLAPPSVAPPPETDRTPQLSDEYQSLATPRVGPVCNENNEV